MAVVRSTNHVVQATGSTVLTFDMDAAGIAVGDWCILAVQAGLTTVTWTNSLSGWTVLGAPLVMGSRRVAVSARKRLAGDPAVFTTTSNATAAQRGVIAGVSGAVDVSSWIAGTFKSRGTMGSDGFHNIIPGVTTVSADNLILTISFEATTADEGGAHPSVVNATEWFFEGQAGAGQNIETIGYYYSTKPTAGLTPDVTLTYLNVQAANGAGIQIAIPPTVTIDPRGSGYPVKVMTAGGLVDKALYIVTAAGVRTPSGKVVVPSGYPTVTAMLATPDFKVAHRGGSASYPEMSLHAYTQSVVKGYKALEVSLARTSDGVWFGLHDSTLDRTSGVTGITASALTWSQVQTYAISASLPSGQVAKPYMRIEEILIAYGWTHVLFLDPKSAVSFSAELLNLVRDFYGSDAEAAKHVVAKYSGPQGNVAGTTGWAVDARARGWKSWGYFYQADFDNGALATYQGRYDLLGMDYNALSSAWTAVKSYGKPVIAHIVPDTTKMAIAQSWAPAGYMVSGTAVVPA